MSSIFFKIILKFSFWVRGFQIFPASNPEGFELRMRQMAKQRNKKSFGARVDHRHSRGRLLSAGRQIRRCSVRKALGKIMDWVFIDFSKTLGSSR